MRRWTDRGFELGAGDLEMLRQLPENLAGSIERYITQGIPPGSFIEAVCRGDLFDAVGRADETSQRYLLDICMWFYNFAPPECYGSRGHFAAWMDRHKSLREAMADPAGES